MKKFGKLLLVLSCSVLLSGAAIASEDKYEAYMQDLDRSCESDADCTIKDAHNCCGYYPECVNVNAKTDAEWVEAYCMREQMDSICGFPDITACHCDHGKCAPSQDIDSGTGINK